MNAALGAELFKQRSTRTVLGLLAAMVALVLLVVLLHGLGLGAADFDTASNQLTILFGWAGVFGALFAGLLGAMSVTSEIRYGTIRTTLLVNPDRRQVLRAKTIVSVSIGFAFGLVAGALVAGIGTAALNARGIDVRLDGGDYVRIVVGSALAAAMWGAIGVAVGAIVRSQVPALVGLVVWLLLIENLLVGDIAGVGAVGRYLPGAAGKAISGQQANSLLSPMAGSIVLALYAIAATVSGSIAIERRDFV
jgi:ABC-2 type transport system permease protein